MTDNSSDAAVGISEGGSILSPESPIFAGAKIQANIGFGWLPAQYRTAREEFLASRNAVSIGFTLNTTPVYDVSGPDAAKLLNSVAVNKDFALLKSGSSKHALLCNDDGYLLADGVVMKVAEDRYRTYWLAPVLDFYVRTSGLDVEGAWVTDEYFFQVDGPKSLEILEQVTGSDLHDLRFARNKTVTLAGGDAVVHRLGMSGALAYEVHGHMRHAQAAFQLLRDAAEAVGGGPQGFWNYSGVNHTVAGYPNQFIHFLYPYRDSGAELAQFFDQIGGLELRLKGSAADDLSHAFVTPYDVGWGYLVNFDHEFRGKQALQRIAQDPPRKPVTLEWNAEDVGEIFAAQFRGEEAVIYDPISADPVQAREDFVQEKLGVDFVLSDGRRIGIATGRTPAYFEKRFVSLAFIEKEYAKVGNEVTVLWGSPGTPQFNIRATVAPFPYYNGEFRNEKFDASR